MAAERPTRQPNSAIRPTPDSPQRRALARVGGAIEIFTGLALLGTVAAVSSMSYRPRDEGLSQELIVRRDQGRRRQNAGEPFPDAYASVRGTRWDPNPAKGGLPALGGPDYDTRAEIKGTPIDPPTPWID